MRVEVTVGAFLNAPGYMDIQGQWRQLHDASDPIADVGNSVLSIQQLQEASHRLSPMADPGLGGRLKFRRAALVVCNVKQRVIAKALFTAWLLQYPSRPPALADQRAGVVRMAQQGNHAVEISITLAVRYVAELSQ